MAKVTVCGLQAPEIQRISPWPRYIVGSKVNRLTWGIGIPHAALVIAGTGRKCKRGTGDVVAADRQRGQQVLDGQEDIVLVFGGVAADAYALAGPVRIIGGYSWNSLVVMMLTTSHVRSMYPSPPPCRKVTSAPSAHIAAVSSRPHIKINALSLVIVLAPVSMSPKWGYEDTSTPQGVFHWREPQAPSRQAGRTCYVRLRFAFRKMPAAAAPSNRHNIPGSGTMVMLATALE